MSSSQLAFYTGTAWQGIWYQECKSETMYMVTGVRLRWLKYDIRNRAKQQLTLFEKD